MRRPCLALFAVLAAASFNAGACYTVYDRADRVVYQSADPPVDMSRPLHETLPSRFPGGHMVFDSSGDCPVTTSVAARGGTSDWTTRSPLLTNERTAIAMRVPHTPLPGGIALVQPGAATLAPALTIVPDTRLASSRSNTSAMGAAPSRRPVITELRDPPVIIEQRGRDVTVRQAPVAPGRY
jgi:hypothetical protein